MPYNLTMDVPSNRDVVDRLRQMDEWIDMRPQYVATNIQPDHFPNRMLVGGVMSGEFLQHGTNNRNTPYHFRETMATASAGKFSFKGAVKKVASVAKPVGKFTYEEIVKPVAREARKEGTKAVVGLAKELLKEAIKSALEGEAGAGRKPRGRGRKPKTVGGNVYPSASAIHSSQRSGAEEGNIATVYKGVEMMDLPSDSVPIDMKALPRNPARRARGAGHSGGGSGGKFNLKKALSSGTKSVGRFVREDYTPFMVNKVAPVAKSVGVIAGREVLPYAIGALGQEFGVPMPVGMAVGNVITKRALSEKNTGVKGGKKAVKCSGGDGRAKRAEIVKKVMKEKGLKMIDASKYVKAHGLY